MRVKASRYLCDISQGCWGCSVQGEQHHDFCGSSCTTPVSAFPKALDCACIQFGGVQAEKGSAWIFPFIDLCSCSHVQGNSFCASKLN